MEHFDAPWDAGLEGITAGVLLACVLAIGVGGFFGCFGLYQAEGSVVVTPAEPERFVAAVRARFGRSS